MANFPILSTKLAVPRVRLKFVTRPRLIAKLNEGLPRKLTLISAPAGFGKTMLLSEWISQGHFKTAWLSLDDSDNDPARFLSYLIAALQSLNPGIGETSLAVLNSSMAVSDKAVLTVLISELQSLLAGDGDRQRPYVLVLDDYHVINNSLVHKAVTFFLENLPARLHLVISSRADPPLPLAKLRAMEQLNEIRLAHLKFSLLESAEFLDKVMGLKISKEDLGFVTARTEGWIAGLQLAALSMQSLDDVSIFVKHFSQTQRYILDYLDDEVFRSQDHETQLFLLQSAVLDRMNGNLCDTLTGRQDGQLMLERLEKANLFVIPFGNDSTWYQYHPLFLDLLRYRQVREIPAQLPGLYQRASEGYEQNGLMFEALRYSLKGKDYDRAIKILEGNNPSTMIMGGELSALLHWLDTIPEEIVRFYPRLSVSYAWALLFTGNFDAIEPHLATAMRSLGFEGSDASDWPETITLQTRGLLGEIAAIRASVASSGDHSRLAITLGLQALERLPAQNWLARIAVYCILGDAYGDINELEAATNAYLEAIAITQKTGNVLGTLQVTSDLGRVQVEQAHLRDAMRSLKRVLERGSQYKSPVYPLVQANVDLGNLYREINDLELAEKHLLNALNQSQLAGYRRLTRSASIGLARVKMNQHLFDDARAYLKCAEDLAEELDEPRASSRIRALQGYLVLAQGNLSAALLWAKSCKIDLDRLDISHNKYEYLIYARILLAAEADGADQVIPLLSKLAEMAESSGRVNSLIEVLILSSLAWQMKGSQERANKLLQQALEKAEPEGYVRIFIDEGRPMARLLHIASAQGIFSRYANQLLEAMGEAGAGSTERTLTEPLTGRELQVLSLLAAGLSNTEIADALKISLVTVKTHVNHVFNKLNVSNRIQATMAAKDLKLIRH